MKLEKLVLSVVMAVPNARPVGLAREDADGARMCKDYGFMPVRALRPQQHSTGLATSCCDMLRPFHSLSPISAMPLTKVSFDKAGQPQRFGPRTAGSHSRHVHRRIRTRGCNQSERVGSSMLHELHDGHGRFCFLV